MTPFRLGTVSASCKRETEKKQQKKPILAVYEMEMDIRQVSQEELKVLSELEAESKLCFFKLITPFSQIIVAGKDGLLSWVLLT